MSTRPLNPEESALVEQHLWIADHLTFRLSTRLPEYTDVADIRSAATQGLIAAVQAWNGDKGTFQSYARTRIKGAMMDHLRSVDWLPRRARHRLRAINSKIQQLEQTFGREVSPDEASAVLAESKVDFLRLRFTAYFDPPKSLDLIIGEDGTTLGSVIADESIASAPDSLEEQERMDAMMAELPKLPEIQRKILALYYFEKMRLAEIGEALGLTESRISQIIREARATLRRRLNKHHEQRTIKKMAPVLPDTRRRKGAQCNRGLAVGDAWRDGDAGNGDGGLSTNRGEGRIAHSAEHDNGSDSHVLEDARDSGAVATDTGFLEHHIRDTRDAEYTAAMTDQALTRDSAWWHDFRAITQELEFWKGQAKAKQREIHRLNLLSPRPIEAETSEVKPFVRSCRAHVAKPVLFAVAIAAACLCLVGCNAFGRVGRIKIPGSSLMPGKTEVKGVADAGTPPTVNTSAEETSLPLPAGSTIVETKTEAVPATETTPAKPAAIVREIKLAADTTWIERAQKIQASAGTIDTSVAKHKADVASRMPLLWCAIACGIGALVLKSMLPQWPALSHGLFLGAGILFASWKFAEVPWWGALLAVGAVALLALGYKRGEWDKNHNGIPDILERTNISTSTPTT